VTIYRLTSLTKQANSITVSTMMCIVMSCQTSHQLPHCITEPRLMTSCIQLPPHPVSLLVRHRRHCRVQYQHSPMIVIAQKDVKPV